MRSTTLGLIFRLIPSINIPIAITAKASPFKKKPKFENEDSQT